MSEFVEYDECQLCPRGCHAARSQGKTGFCGETDQLSVASIVAHFGEEPCLTGKKGSGTVFFSGCQTGCFFCQNYQISAGHLGQAKSWETVAEDILKLCEGGVHNVNFVTPEPWWPHIRKICSYLRNKGVWVPFVWNSSGYFKKELLEEQTDLIDIFLPDFKFFTPELSKMCMGREDYSRVVMDGLRYLVDKVGFLRPFDETGDITASRGVMVRHLVLPGEVANSLEILRWLADEFGDRLPVSVMRQYQPMPECFRRGLLTRPVTDEEYECVCNEIDRLGFRHVFVQTGELNNDFLPDFTKNDPFAGNLKHRKD